MIFEKNTIHFLHACREPRGLPELGNMLPEQNKTRYILLNHSVQYVSHNVYVLVRHASQCGCCCFLPQLLYTFDKQVCVSSCSLNKEETLLGEPANIENTNTGFCIHLLSKCLTLLIEIHPINNTKVLKAVDCRVKVQVHFACQISCFYYVDLYHILLTRQEGYRVVSPEYSIHCGRYVRLKI
uniref:Uncharacterized protein n=1 Tax=Periophthalmus magnuspinnatus TaxID=409849 RepID=A0A3B3ZW06_9GOBI